jgi:hypothetical protein
MTHRTCNFLQQVVPNYKLSILKIFTVVQERGAAIGFPLVRLSFADMSYLLRGMATLLNDTPNYVGLADKGINKHSTSNLVDKTSGWHFGRAGILGHVHVNSPRQRGSE